jgi:hypothetical protein
MWTRFTVRGIISQSATLLIVFEDVKGHGKVVTDLYTFMRLIDETNEHHI